MNTATLDAGLPCQNPNCKSHGKPHPNCKCYQGLAKGGSTKSFCSTNGIHDKSCEYYRNGGEVLEPVPNNKLPDGLSQFQESGQNMSQFQESGQNMSQSDLIPVPDDKLPDEIQNQNKYSTPLQQAAAALEGGAQGYLGPLATGAELGLSKLGVPGISAEDIKGRKEANPLIHATAEMAGTTAGVLSGTGEMALLSKLGELKTGASIGSRMIRGALETGGWAAGDEISKAMIGDGDPNDAVSSALINTGVGALMGGAAGGLFGLIGKASQTGLKVLENKKYGDKAKGLLTGIGKAVESKNNGSILDPEEFKEMIEHVNALHPEESINYNDFKKGVDIVNTGSKKYAQDLAKTAGGTVGAVLGPAGVPVGEYAGKYILTPLIEKTIDKHILGSNKIAPALLKSMSEGNLGNLADIMDHATQVYKGDNKATKALDWIFKSAPYKTYDISDKLKDKIDDYIGNGELNNEMNQESSPQQYAEGGEVSTTPANTATEGVANTFNTHTMKLAEAKARTYNYLNQLYPRQKPNQFIYDSNPDMKDDKKKYNDARDLAIEPIKILEHVKKNTLTPELMSHFKSLYPDVYNYLNKKINMRIAEQRLDDEKPNYKTRQSLSLFLGSPLDMTFSPNAIQSVQSIFAPKQAQQPAQPQRKPKTKASLTKFSNQYKTTSQSAESDRSSRN